MRRERARPGALHHLPGRRIAVSRLADYPRAAATASILFGALPLLMKGLPGPRLERFWARTAARLVGIDLTMAGTRHIDPNERYLVASLHEGFADVPALLHLPLSLKFVARGELARWRTLGPHLVRAGHPIIDPERPRNAYRTLRRRAEEVFASGHSLVVFPQGTILGIESAFTRGAFALADALGRPLLPVVLTGSHRIWEHPYSPLVRFGCPMSLRVLPPIPPGEALDTMGRVEGEMKRLALEAIPAPRRFVPERDGWWEGYRYEIDPSFPDLVARVAHHRAGSTGS